MPTNPAGHCLQPFQDDFGDLIYPSLMPCLSFSSRYIHFKGGWQ